MPSLKLRPYQEKGASAFSDFVNQGHRRGIIVLPTGCGKTILGIHIAKVLKAKRILWIAHREELIFQPLKSLKLVAPEYKPGIVKAERNEYHRDFVFASVQTASRKNRLENLKDFDLVVIDECHHAAADSYQKIIRGTGCLDEGGPILLGLTATPERTDLLRLDDTFEKIVFQYSLYHAIKDGFLCPVDVREEKINVDFNKIRKVGDDFSQKELDLALLEAGIVDSICSAVEKHCRGLKTVIFTISVAQAKQVSEKLCAMGYKASHIYGELNYITRRTRIKDFKTGKIEYLVNCMVATEGFDEPSIRAIVIGRPTQSVVLYRQIAGRGVRIFPGKERCIIVDLVGVSDCHSLIQAPVIFGVDGEGFDEEKVNRKPRDDEGNDERLIKLLSGQLRGTEPVARSVLNWVQAKEGLFALNCGDGGTVLMRQVDEEGACWRLEVIGRKDSEGLEILTEESVDMQLAQGIAEDYVRRANAVYLGHRSTRWRDMPASDAQIKALARWKVKHPLNITRGQASDMLTKASASSWRHDRATTGQKRMLKAKGIDFDPDTLTKGEAARMIAKLMSNK